MIVIVNVGQQRGKRHWPDSTSKANMDWKTRFGARRVFAAYWVHTSPKSEFRDGNGEVQFRETFRAIASMR